MNTMYSTWCLDVDTDYYFLSWKKKKKKTKKLQIKSQRLMSVLTQLLIWCFEPSQPQMIKTRLNTKFNLSPSHSLHKSSYHKSCFFSLFIFRRPQHGLVSQLVLSAQSTTKEYIRAEQKLHPITKLFISQVIVLQVMFFSLYVFRGHSQQEPASGSHLFLFCRPTQEPAPILFCGPTQEAVSATSNTRKNWERFWKNAGEWTGRVEISKEEIPGSKHSMYDYIVTYSRL